MSTTKMMAATHGSHACTHSLTHSHNIHTQTVRTHANSNTNTDKQLTVNQLVLMPLVHNSWGLNHFWTSYKQRYKECVPLVEPVKNNIEPIQYIQITQTTYLISQGWLGNKQTHYRRGNCFQNFSLDINQPDKNSQ